MPTDRWDARQRASLLAGVRLFAGLPPPALADLAARFRPRAVPRAGFIFLEGQTAGSLHVAAQGRVKIVRETAAGKQVILRLIQPGEPFGLSGALDSDGGATFPATAQALDPAVVLQLPARDLRELLAAYPPLALALVRELTTRLREAEARILDLQTEDVERRLARALLRLVNAAPSSTAPGRVVAVAITRQDLADLSGSTLSTASRTLSAWHRRGIVLALREKVVVIDAPALGRIAHG